MHKGYSYSSADELPALNEKLVVFIWLGGLICTGFMNDLNILLILPVNEEHKLEKRITKA